MSQKAKPKSEAVKLQEQIDAAWKDYSLDAPRLPNPIPSDTLGLRNMCMIIHLVLPICKIFVGIRYVHHCPTNNWIPTYMLVGGILQLTFLIALTYKPFRISVLLGPLGIANLMWMLIASLNIFVEWKPDFFLGGWRYCNKTLFYFAFFSSISEYIIISVLILYVCSQFAYSTEDTTQIV